MVGDNGLNGTPNQKFATKCRAPGRVNLIGGHTDYNNGYVLPVAIDATVDIRGTSQDPNRIDCYTATFDESTQINLDELSDVSSGWAQYIAAVTEILRRNDYSIRGITCRIDATLPIGVGLASSAALEVAWAGMLRSLFDLSVSNRQLATFCHTAEHDIVGVSCGIMDQFTAMLAKRGHAMFLDCRDHSIQHIPIDTTTYTLVVINSKVTHELVDSAYNTRQQECETGVDILNHKLNREITSLRDVSLSEFQEIKNEIPQPYQDRV
ncbi:MAG: galactokinase, partial [Halobacteriaceae archaeon]